MRSRNRFLLHFFRLSFIQLWRFRWRDSNPLPPECSTIGKAVIYKTEVSSSNPVTGKLKKNNSLRTVLKRLKYKETRNSKHVEWKYHQDLNDPFPHFFCLQTFASSSKEKFLFYFPRVEFSKRIRISNLQGCIWQVFLTTEQF